MSAQEPSSALIRATSCHPDAGWVLLEGLIPEPASQTDKAVLGADGRIYVAAGWLGFSYTNRVVRFDPEDEIWEEWSFLSQPRNNLGLVLAGDGRVLAIGGDYAFSPLASVECLTAPCGADRARPMLMDFDGDGRIGILDFLELLARWGLCP